MHDTYSVPTPKDQENFVYRLYFGADGDALDQVIRRAYLDLSRTIHGAGSCPDGQKEAALFLRREIESLPSNIAALTQQGFDQWHEATCSALCAVYSTAGYDQFFIGQSQKWINMAMKYIYVFGETRLPGYAPHYRLCHVPIDNILLKANEFKELACFTEPWSRIKEYSAYMSFQSAVRCQFPDSAPLAVEFVAWQSVNAATRASYEKFNR